MAIYLGSAGYLTLQRSAEGQFQSTLDPDDVNAGASRFSFDFPSGTFVTGDHLVIRRLEANGSASTRPLDFVTAAGWANGSVQSDGSWYAHVDAIGGIRLYHSWADSLVGAQAKAIALRTPTASFPISVRVDDRDHRCLAQVSEFALSTERSALDVTALGDQFAQQISGIVSGSGRIQCYWDWAPAICQDSDLEYAQYLHQLILRQQVGSEFKAELVLKRRNEGPVDADLAPALHRTALFYDITGIITSVGISVAPDEPLASSIEFVTTGDIQLRYDVPAGDRILQENSDRISIEDETGWLLQEYLD